MSKFGERLKQLRTERGLTQIELSEKVNINYSTLSDYEREERKDPCISTISFNPHARTGRDAKIIIMYVMYRRFQSTRPHGA